MTRLCSSTHLGTFRGRRWSRPTAGLAVGSTLILAACSSVSSGPLPSGPSLSAVSTTSTSTSTSTSTPTGATSPSGARSSTSSASPAVETHPPGDIPDTQAFVAFTATGYQVSIPEGWARTMLGTRVTFADKYNSITVDATAGASAPTIASVRSQDLPRIRAATPGFRAGAISIVARPAGAAVLMTYQALSPVNPVTGKVTVQAVERYAFWRAGREVVLTLAAPVGSDNVDPWRKVTDSMRWSRR